MLFLRKQHLLFINYFSREQSHLTDRHTNKISLIIIIKVNVVALD